jgi:hypothetical protein
VTAPTCTSKGYTTHTCACGNSYVDTYVDATGHQVPATSHSCTVCGVVTTSCGESFKNYGDGYVIITNSGIAALKPTTYIQKMSVQTLLERVNFCVKEACDSNGSIFEEIYATEEFRHFVTNDLGLDVDTLTGENAANALVLYAAHLIGEMNKDEIVDFLKASNKYDTIRNGTDHCTNTFIRSVLVYGVYCAYAYHSEDDMLIANLDSITTSIRNSDSEGFIAYISDGQGTADLNGFLAALEMIDKSTESREAVE